MHKHRGADAFSALIRFSEFHINLCAPQLSVQVRAGAACCPPSMCVCVIMCWKHRKRLVVRVDLYLVREKQPHPVNTFRRSSAAAPMVVWDGPLSWATEVNTTAVYIPGACSHWRDRGVPAIVDIFPVVCRALRLPTSVSMRLAPSQRKNHPAVPDRILLTYRGAVRPWRRPLHCHVCSCIDCTVFLWMVR